MKRAVDADDIESLVLIAELVNTISKKIKQLPNRLLWWQMERLLEQLLILQ